MKTSSRLCMAVQSKTCMETYVPCVVWMFNIVIAVSVFQRQ